MAEERRRRLRSLGVIVGVSILAGTIISVPILTWIMGINGDVQHVYTETLPTDNRGAYLLTDQGVMQLFAWHLELDQVPEDAPTLDAAGLDAVAIVQKQFYPPEQYALLRIDAGVRIDWQSSRQEGTQLFLDPGPLQPGAYMLIVETDEMFGGRTYHYFRVR